MKSFNSILKLKFGITNEDENLFKCIFYFNKKITDELNLMKNAPGIDPANEDSHLFTNVLEKIQIDWKECILQKCQQLTTFCSI